MNNKCGALLIFSKAPVAGKVKTRLIPALGSQYSTKIYKELILKTFLLSQQTTFSCVQLWVDGDRNHPLFKEIRSRSAIKIYQQFGHDLGQRMFHAFALALKKYPYTILIGCDCPLLTAEDLRLSKNILQKKDVVLGPALDGGYYLIGLRQNDAYLFQHIKWGTKHVLATTMKRIQALNWHYETLEEYWDLDNSRNLLPYFRIR